MGFFHEYREKTIDEIYHVNNPQKQKASIWPYPIHVKVIFNTRVPFNVHCVSTNASLLAKMTVIHLQMQCLEDRIILKINNVS